MSANGNGAPVQTLPAVILVYGDPKTSKTTSAGYSFPRGLFLAVNYNALKPVLTVCGYKPAWREVHTIAEATTAIREVTSNGGADKYDAVIVDDLSILADASYQEHGRKAGRDGFLKHDRIVRDILEFREAAQSAGLHVEINAHPREPQIVDGKFHKGGPRMPERGLTGAVPPLCDVVLRVCIDPERQPFPSYYACDPADPNWTTGDRHNVAPKAGPMNTAELLRESTARGFIIGRPVRRLPGLEAQEGWVEGIAKRLEDGEEPKAVAQLVYERLSGKNIPANIIAWTLRDGFDRFAFRKTRGSILAGFGVDVGAKKSAPVDLAASES